MNDPAPDPDRAHAAGQEVVDVLDDAGAVVGTATRAQIRAANLWHRSVFIAVVTSAGEVVVHQRAAWKDVWPSRWDCCFGGVLDAGEGWDAAAVRELGEEAGVIVTAAALELLGEGRYEDAGVREIGRIYLVRSDGPFTYPDGEVAASAAVALAGLATWMDAHEVCPDSRALVLPRLLVAATADPDRGVPT